MSVKGNKNAEKYTPDNIVELFTGIIDGLFDGTYATYTQALLRNRLYTQLVDQWLNETHKENKAVIGIIKKAKGIAADALFNSVCESSVPVPAGLFGLKAKHGWVEKGVELEATAKKNLVQIEMVKATE